MPSIPIHHHLPSTTTSTPLPSLFRTPNGLAILELQASINTDDTDTNHNNAHDHDHDYHSPNAQAPTFETPIGKLMFPDYSPLTSADDTTWMKRVYLYVGRYQRMSGEVKKLGNPIAVVRKTSSDSTSISTSTEDTEELEIVDVVRYKIAFKNRPEPVNDG